jgi:hypothetical protein
MKKRFNIILIPISKGAEVAAIAKKLYSISAGYKAGEGSLPHVTLCQFYADREDINPIWKGICETSINKTIDLKFESISCLNVIGYNWVSLVPNNLDELMKMHLTVTSFIDKPIGKCFEKFDAHMTLINTLMDDYKGVVAEVLPEVFFQDTFKLAVGESDEVGRLENILYKI